MWFIHCYAMYNKIKDMALNIINDDCMNWLPYYKKNAFELAIVDPPYGIGNFTSQNDKKDRVKISKFVTWNDKIPETNYFKEIRRISKKQIIWGANYYNCFQKGGAVIWYKGDFAKNQSQCEIASLSFKKSTDFIYINWQPEFHRNNIETIIHQCQKPIKLYKWLLHNYANESDRILDTHLGSGSIALACHDYGFDLTGFETDKDYYDAAMQRIKIHTAQIKLFT